MADPTALDVILEPIALIFNGLARVQWLWYASWAGTIALLPLKLLWVPVSILINLILFILSPLIYVGAFIGSVVAAVYRLFAGLAPLYTFFGVAASVGVLAGLFLAVFSSTITSSLGLHAGRQGERPMRIKYEDHSEEADISQDDESSSNEEDIDWQWPDTSSPTRRRHVSGLLSETIHEEDDDSSDVSL